MKRILVADDSVTIQKVIALTFADEPFEVQSVGTGSEALEVVKNWKPDIVLADVIMPQMNGYELCKAVKQQEETSTVPVLLLAGTFEAFDEEEARSVGADGFITKPFESGELIDKVRTLIGDVPAAAPAQPATAPPEAPPPAEPPAPSAAPPAFEAPAAPAQEGPGPASEPDIWDILSESSEEIPAEGSAVKAPGFGPTGEEGVVDFGSFDVSTGRPESQPPPVQPAAEPGTAPGQGQDPVQAAPAPPAAPGPPGLDEKSRVEDMEKDFFGFETGAVEEATSSGIIDDAVEEVTFEIEQPPVAQQVDAQEASFVVPEPADDQAVVTGETLSPDFMAPDFTPAAEPPSDEIPISMETPDDRTEGAVEKEAPPLEVPVPDSIDIPGFVPEPMIEQEAPVPVQPEEAPVPETAPVSDQILEPEPQPEPPLELSVDLTSDLPEEVSPGQAPPDVPEAPLNLPEEPAPEISPEPVQAPPPQPVPQTAVGTPDDDAIRKIVEEKVEKIAWEVVPEMAEVIIREAIQKIKDGT